MSTQTAPQLQASCPMATSKKTQPLMASTSSASSQGGCPFSSKFSLRPAHKPTYASLIALAIHASPEKRLMLNEIYEFVNAHRSLVPTASQPNWKNSVRHNLSLRPCFKKVPRYTQDGKKLSAYWALDTSCLPSAAEAVVAKMDEMGSIEFPEQFLCKDEEGEATTSSTKSRSSSPSTSRSSNKRSHHAMMQAVASVSTAVITGQHSYHHAITDMTPCQSPRESDLDADDDMSDDESSQQQPQRKFKTSHDWSTTTTATSGLYAPMYAIKSENGYVLTPVTLSPSSSPTQTESGMQFHGSYAALANSPPGTPAASPRYHQCPVTTSTSLVSGNGGMDLLAIAAEMLSK